MNGWYERITHPMMNMPQQMQKQQSFSGPVFRNPIQKAAYIMKALTNPAAFVKEQFPDIPDGISHDPVQVRNYLQQSRGISDQQLQQLMQQYPMPRF